MYCSGSNGDEQYFEPFTTTNEISCSLGGDARVKSHTIHRAGRALVTAGEQPEVPAAKRAAPDGCYSGTIDGGRTAYAFCAQYLGEWQHSVQCTYGNARYLKHFHPLAAGSRHEYTCKTNYRVTWQEVYVF